MPMFLQARPAQRRPFADWQADVERRIQRRTGVANATNLVPSDYWLSLFHCGEDAWAAADEFITSYRGQL